MWPSEGASSAAEGYRPTGAAAAQATRREQDRKNHFERQRFDVPGFKTLFRRAAELRGKPGSQTKFLDLDERAVLCDRVIV